MFRKLLNLFRDGQRDTRALDLPPSEDERLRLIRAALAKIKHNQKLWAAAGDERQVALIKHLYVKALMANACSDRYGRMLQ